MSFLKSKLSSSQHQSHIDGAFASANEGKIIASWLYLGYKHFLSSQDGSSCVYYPSCSTYAVRYIQKKGLLEGVMAAFDRLTRCNPYAAQYYPIYIDKKRLYDPVDKEELHIPPDRLQYLPDF